MVKKGEGLLESVSQHLCLIIRALNWPGDKFRSLHSLSCIAVAGCGKSSLGAAKACGGESRVGGGT